MIVHDPRNPRAVALRAEILERRPELAQREDLTLVIGGDGFLLHTVHRYGFDRVYLGLNGGTLGFLLNDVKGRVPEVCEAIARNAWSEQRFSLLEATVVRVDGEQIVDTAMNDVYLERSSGQTARVTLAIDGNVLVEQLAADGLIFATALGSTGYSYSAGGSPCAATLPVMCVTPICSHKPRLAPFVVAHGTVAEVQVMAPDRRPVRAVVDGRDVPDVSRVVVGPSAHQVRMAWLDGYDSTLQLVRKLMT